MIKVTERKVTAAIAITILLKKKKRLKIRELEVVLQAIRKTTRVPKKREPGFTGQNAQAGAEKCDWLEAYCFAINKDNRLLCC